jgi:hypothetical protein
MATRENQGLQIGLIVCVLIIVVLMVLFFFAQKAKEEAALEKVQMQERLNTAEAGARKANDDLTKMKAMIGYAQEAELKDIETQHKTDMTMYADNWPEENRNYRELPGYLIGRLMDSSKSVRDTQVQVERMRTERDKAREEEEQATAQYKDKSSETAEEMAVRSERFKEDRQRMTQENQKYATDVQRERKEKQRMEDEKNQLLAKSEDTIRTLDTTNKKLQTDIDLLTYEKIGIADGNVAWVNHRDRLAYLDVGSEDGLRPLVTFSVFDKGEKNFQPERKKGALEVIQVLGAHRALARILETDASRVILPRDVLYSTAWDRGRHLHFALAGKMDIDGDDKTDREMIREIISMNGGVIDAEVDEDGNQTGEMSFETRFLIIGDTTIRLSESTPDDFEENGDNLTNELANAVAGNLSEIIGQAQQYSVQRISLEEFLDLMGWQGSVTTKRLGVINRSRENKSAAEGGTNESEEFRERSPALLEDDSF